MFIVASLAVMVIHCCIWFEQKSQLLGTFNSLNAGDLIIRPWRRHCFNAGGVIFRNNQVPFAVSQHRDRDKAIISALNELRGGTLLKPFISR